MSDQALVDQFIANGGSVTQVETEVSLGMKRSDYLPRRVAPGQVVAEKLSSGDTKFDMYLNALPGELRKWALATSQDVRKLYKEYRALKKEGLVAKYQPAVAEWEQVG